MECCYVTVMFRQIWYSGAVVFPRESVLLVRLLLHEEELTQHSQAAN